MAVNGVTESFIASVATTRDLARQSRAMVVFSMVFLAASWGLLKGLGLGGEGLVWANCINLGVRIIWSCSFIISWYTYRNESVRWSRVQPTQGTIVSSVLIGLGIRICARNESGFIETICLVGVGALSLISCMYFPRFFKTNNRAHFELEFLRKAYYTMIASLEKVE